MSHIQVCLVGWDASSNHTMNYVTELVLPAVGLTGTLGVALCDLKTLLRLDLGVDMVNQITNSITDAVPMCLFLLPQLQFLNLESNQLTGSALPDTLPLRFNEGMLFDMGKKLLNVF